MSVQEVGSKAGRPAGLAGVTALLLLFAAMIGPGPGDAWAAPGARTSAVWEQNAESGGYWTPGRVKQALANDLGGEAGAATGVSAAAAEPPQAGVSHSYVPPEFSYPAIGKVIFRWLGSPASCSGTLINSASKRLVLTAGHCVSEFGLFGTRYRFIPGLDKGVAPFGLWGVSEVGVQSDWYRSFGFNPNFDFGMLVLRQPAGRWIGAINVKLFPAKRKFVRIIGYPGAAAQGKLVRMCSSPAWPGNRLSHLLPGPVGIVARCNMAAGSSGGPWLSRVFDQVNRRWEYRIAGLTSTGNRVKLSSPYFGIKLRQFIRIAESRHATG